VYRLAAAASAALLVLLSPLQAGPARKSHAPRPKPPARLRAPVRPRASRPPHAGPHAGLSDQNAEELLRRMLQAENSLALSGDQVTTVARGGLDIASEQQVQRRGADALRIDYVRPARLAGEQIIDNGRFFCHLVPDRDTLELSPSHIQSLRVRVPDVLQRVRSGDLVVQWVGQDVVAGHACGVVRVAARGSGPVPWRRFWIDPTNGAQLRIEQYDSRDRLQSASYYTQITYNPRFDRGTFSLPHTGSRIVTSGFESPRLTLDQARAQTGFPLAVPTYLPSGFRFQAASVSDKRGRRVAELRFFNGANTLSVFETPDAQGGGPGRTEHPRHGVLFGRQPGRKVVVIGNLGDGELDRVLNSLRP